MKTEAQRIAIAEACGWIIKKEYRYYNLYNPQGILVGGELYADLLDCFMPDYLNDLNAMAVAEEILTDEQAEEYDERLSKHGIFGSYTWAASANEKSEQFLKTLKLWEE